MTTDVPRASDKGMFRRGSFTSPAVKVMLFQASAENKDPVCATQMAANKPNAVTADSPGTMSAASLTDHIRPKLSATAAGFQPSVNPTRTNATTAPVLADVKRF